MKISLSLIAFLLVTILLGCASSPEAKRASEFAKSNTFEFFFGSPSEVRMFDSLEEAKDFVNAAKIKLSSSINMRSAQGLAARLQGPSVNETQPVAMTYFLNAWDEKGEPILLGRAPTDLKIKLQRAISVSLVFLVFYGDRATSISDFYLAEGYRYTTNSQFQQFSFKGQTYTAKYPIGWTGVQAFRYLDKVID